MFEDQTSVPFPDWQDLAWPEAVEKPFRSSLNGSDRHMLVRQTSESWLDRDGVPISPVPVDVTNLWLSALGAWLDLHGEWETTRYAAASIRPIEACGTRLRRVVTNWCASSTRASSSRSGTRQRS